MDGDGMGTDGLQKGRGGPGSDEGTGGSMVPSVQPARPCCPVQRVGAAQNLPRGTLVEAGVGASKRALGGVAPGYVQRRELP